MGCSGRRSWRRVGAVAVALVAFVGAGCADGDAAPDAASDATDETETADVGADAPAPTTEAPPPPDGVVIDDALVERMPRLPETDRVIGDDTTFDDRLCDGSAAPAAPVGQAEATYELDIDETLRVVALRFAGDEARAYLRAYEESIPRCVLEVSRREELALADGGVGFLFQVSTEDGVGFFAMASVDDTLWVSYQSRADGGSVDVLESDLEAFLVAAEG